MKVVKYHFFMLKGDRMKKIWILLVVLFSLNPIYSQSNLIIDEVLEQELIDFDKGVYIILAAGGLIEENASGSQVSEALDKQNWNIHSREVSGKMTLIEASILIMNSLDLKGGVMYTLLPIKRYAYKEMIFKKLIENTADGNREISGVELLTILGKSLSYKEENGNA